MISKTKYPMDRPADLGRVVIGERAKGKGYPVKLDYFKIVQGRDKEGGQVTDYELMERLDPDCKPREIEVYLPFDGIDDVWHTERRMYGRQDPKDPESRVMRKCWCSNGEHANFTHPDGRVEIGICKGDECKYAQPMGTASPDCKKFGRLYFAIKLQPIIGGLYRFQTTSRHSIGQIQTSLETISRLTGGYLAGPSFILALRSVISDTPVGKQTLYIVNIEFHGNQKEFLEAAAQLIAVREKRRAELSGYARLLLNAPETEQDNKEVQGEFYPEAETVEPEPPFEDVEAVELPPDEIPGGDDQGAFWFDD